MDTEPGVKVGIKNRKRLISKNITIITYNIIVVVK